MRLGWFVLDRDVVKILEIDWTPNGTRYFYFNISQGCFGVVLGPWEVEEIDGS